MEWKYGVADEDVWVKSGYWLFDNVASGVNIWSMVSVLLLSAGPVELVGEKGLVRS